MTRLHTPRTIGPWRLTRMAKASSSRPDRKASKSRPSLWVFPSPNSAACLRRRTIRFIELSVPVAITFVSPGRGFEGLYLSLQMRWRARRFILLIARVLAPPVNLDEQGPVDNAMASKEMSYRDGTRRTLPDCPRKYCTNCSRDMPELRSDAARPAA